MEDLDKHKSRDEVKASSSKIEVKPTTEDIKPLNNKEFNKDLKVLIDNLNKLLIDNNISNKNIIKLNKNILMTYYKEDKIRKIKPLLNKYSSIPDDNTNEDETDELKREKQREYNKKWREDHKDKIKEYTTKPENKEKIKEYQKKYYEEHPEKLKDLQEKRRINSREYYNKNKVNILQKMKTKYQNNKEIINKYNQEMKNKDENKEENNLI